MELGRTFHQCGSPWLEDVREGRTMPVSFKIGTLYTLVESGGHNEIMFPDTYTSLSIFGRTMGFMIVVKDCSESTS